MNTEKSLIEKISVDEIKNPYLKTFVEGLKSSDRSGADFRHHKDGHRDYFDHPDSDADYACS